MSYKLYEELKIKSNKKLRDSIHDIIIDLKYNEFFDLGTLCNILRHKYNVYITPNLLKRFLKLWTEGKDSVFNKRDKKWLVWDDKKEILKNNFSIRRGSVLGKSKKKLRKVEEEELYKSLEKDGWVKLSDNRFVYRGSKSFDVDDNDINKTYFEKDSYEPNENPITVEIVKGMFVLDHPDDANMILTEIDNHIKMGKIISSPKNGAYYYYQCFRYMMTIADSLNLDYIRGWERKFAPSKMQKMIVKSQKRIEYEKEQKELASKDLITDREKSLNELKNIVSLNKRYFLLVTKYDDKKKVFMIKKLIYGYFDISDYKYNDGYYKVVIKKDKKSDDIIFFDTIKYLEICIDGGLKSDKDTVFNIFKTEEYNKLKQYFIELKRYKNWDEFIDNKLFNMLKNDF